MTWADGTSQRWGVVAYRPRHPLGSLAGVIYKQVALSCLGVRPLVNTSSH